MKITDLAFYKGVSPKPQSISFKSNMNDISTHNITYPLPIFDQSTNQFFEVIYAPNSDVGITNKILNNSIETINGLTPLGINCQCYFVTYVAGEVGEFGTNFLVNMRVPAVSTNGEEKFYDIAYPGVILEDILAEKKGDAQVKGLKVVQQRPLNPISSITFFAAYPCAVLEYNSNAPGTVINYTNFSANDLDITDFAVSTWSNVVYVFITSDNTAFWYDTVTLALTSITLPSGFTSLTAVGTLVDNGSVNDNTVYIAGEDTLTTEQKLFAVDVLTNTQLFYRTVGAGGTHKINKIKFAWAQHRENSSTYEIETGTEDGLFRLNATTGATITTLIASIDAKDFFVKKYNGFTVTTSVAATPAGIFHKTNAGSTFSLNTSTSYKSIDGYQFFSVGENIVGIAGKTTNGATFFEFSGATTTTNVTIANSESYNFNSVMNFDNYADHNPGIIIPGTAGMLGNSLWQLHFQTGTANQLGTQYYMQYNAVLDDLIKYDTSIFYGLISVIGCGSSDQNAILLFLDYEKEQFLAGEPGVDLQTNKFWIAQNFFVLNNLKDPTSLYYKSLNNINLNELNDSEQTLASQDEGQFSTTEAGDVIDIIVDRSLFYIVGSRNIEVWQNQGAQGFPYRKQAYLTIPIHNFSELPVLDSEYFPEETFLTRYAPYKQGYILLAMDSQKISIDLIYIKSGRYQEIPYNKVAWQTIMTDADYLGGKLDDDFMMSVNTTNFYSDPYIAILFYNGRDVIGTIFINEAGDLFFTSYQQTNLPNQAYYISPTQNGIFAYADSATRTIRAIFAPQLPLSEVVYVDSARNMVLVSNMLRSQTGDLNVQKIYIQFAYPVSDRNSGELGTYTLSYSLDGQIFTSLGAQSYSKDARQIVTQLNVTMPSCVIKFESTIPIIILSASMAYDETGIM